MERTDLLAAQKLFGVPEEFFEEANAMVKESEWILILAMGPDPVPEKELEKKVIEAGLAWSAPDFIRECYHRAVINKVPREDGMYWQINSFYGRFPYFAQYERYEYGKFPRGVKEALNRWDFEVYLGIYGDDVRAKMQGIDTHVHNSDYLTLEEAFAFVDKHADECGFQPCNCKAMMYYHDRPVDVCLIFETGPNSEMDRGHGTHVTAEEAKKRLLQANRKGLMQNGEDYAICNCDGYCCYPLQMARACGSRGIYPKSHYSIVWDEEKCIQCGKCTKICNFGAFSRGEDRKVGFDPGKCWGCTICSANCPVHAITLVPETKGQN